MLSGSSMIRSLFLIHSFQSSTYIPQSHNEHDDSEGGSGTAVISKIKTQVKEPSLYKVLLHNDDFTPMDFVVQILEEIFHFDHAKSQKIMMDVHMKGIGCCGIFPFDIAETKVSIVTEMAKSNEYPLKCSMEK